MVAELRSPEAVAKRALVMGAIAFRAWLEAASDPRCPSMASQVAPWLQQLGIGNAIDPIENDILNTDYGKLDRSQTIDANWSAEGAAVFCWALGISDNISLFEVTDPTATIKSLRIMRLDANELLNEPVLRGEGDLLSFCKMTLLIHTKLREVHVLNTDLDKYAQATAISAGRKFVQEELEKIGIKTTDCDFVEAERKVASAKLQPRSGLSGAYVARHVAATWLFDKRSTYYL